jgi:hypothetical protein
VIIHESTYEKEGWINLEKESPPVNKKVKLARINVLDWGLENLEWETEGELKNNGIFSITAARGITLSNNKPTHWKKVITESFERFHPTDLKNLSFEDAVQLAKQNRYTVRQIKVNGASCGITDDFDLNRINVEVVDGIVVKVVDVS